MICVATVRAVIGLICLSSVFYVAIWPHRLLIHYVQRVPSYGTLTDQFLGTLPFIEDDPFIIHDLPNCYIVGNQPYFDSRWLQENGKINSRPGQLMLPNLHRGEDGSLPKILAISSGGFSGLAQSRLHSYRAHVNSKVRIIFTKKASLHHHHINRGYLKSSSLRI